MCAHTGSRSRLPILILGAMLSGSLSLLSLVGCSSHNSPASAPTPAAVAPTISTEPAAQSLYVGDIATFTAAVTGTPAPLMQWSKNGTAIMGANSATYSTPPLTAADDGSTFTLTATNSAGSVTSNAAKLTVAVKAPAVTKNPVSISVNDGASATFSVTATGTAPLTFQWSRGPTAIAGATSSSYTLSKVTAADNGAVFTVNVSNSAGTATSNPATLTVNAVLPAITTQPAALTQFVGETATFSVAATGSALTYQWRQNGAAISGATASTYTTPTLTTAEDKASYDVLVTSAAGTVTSAPALLRVGPFATSFTTQKGAVLNLYAWPGTKYAFLSKTADISPVLMRQILAAADGAWNYYAAAVGKLPGIFINYNGLGTIANTGVGGVDLCGDGCTYIGATGMEISDRITGLLLANVPRQYDWVMFYETGRSFWLFHDQLEYKAPDNSSCEVTGFAVFMGIHSLLQLGLPTDYGTNIPNNPDPFKNEILSINSYAADPSLNFQNTFQTSTFNSPYGDCPVLWTGLVQQLSLKYGGETFIQALFKEVLKRPAATTTQDAVDNFVLAASAAAGKNLTYTFGTTWKWPISVPATQEASSKYGSPE